MIQYFDVSNFYKQENEGRQVLVIWGASCVQHMHILYTLIFNYHAVARNWEEQKHQHIPPRNMTIISG